MWGPSKVGEHSYNNYVGLIRGISRTNEMEYETTLECLFFIVRRGSPNKIAEMEFPLWNLLRSEFHGFQLGVLLHVWRASYSMRCAEELEKFPLLRKLLKLSQVVRANDV